MRIKAHIRNLANISKEGAVPKFSFELFEKMFGSWPILAEYHKFASLLVGFNIFYSKFPTGCLINVLNIDYDFFNVWSLCSKLEPEARDYEALRAKQRGQLI